MKKSILSLFLILSFILTCKAQDSYHIIGKLEGFATGTKVNLALTATRKVERLMAEAVVSDGVFSFSGKVEEPRLCRLTITEPSGCTGSHVFMLENAEIKIFVTKGRQIDQWRMEFAKCEVDGSVSDEVFQEKMSFRQELDNRYIQMQEKYRGINEQMAKAFREGNREEQQKLESSESYKEYLNAEEDFFNDMKEMMYVLFRENGDSFWGPLLLLHNVSAIMPSDTVLIGIFNNFSEEAKQSFYGKILAEECAVKTQAGQSLPLFALPDRNGKIWPIEELGKGKKLLLVDFWASWCTPCRRSIPVLKEMYKELSTKGFEIVSVSIDQKEADWLKALDEEQFPWPALLDTQNVFSEKFNGKAVPTFILVDSEGVILYSSVSVEELSQRIKSLEL